MTKKHNLPSLDKAAQQALAVFIVDHPEYTLKQIAYIQGIPYATVYRILKERVNINKTLSLRYPPTTDPK